MRLPPLIAFLLLVSPAPFFFAEKAVASVRVCITNKGAFVARPRALTTSPYFRYSQSIGDRITYGKTSCTEVKYPPPPSMVGGRKLTRLTVQPGAKVLLGVPTYGSCGGEVIVHKGDSVDYHYTVTGTSANWKCR